MECEKINILNSIFGYHYPNGDEKLFYCPKCDHSKRKLSINLEKNVFKCWVCDFVGNDVGYLVKMYGNMNQTSEWFSSFRVDLSSMDDYETLFDIKQDKPPVVDLDLPKGFTTLSSFDGRYSEPLSYLFDR